MKYCPICERTYADETPVCAFDGSILRIATSGEDTFVGKTIKERYRVIEKLGEGGMSVVYLAEQINIGRKVALKLLHEEYARDDVFIRRFRQEAKLAASLSHRNVIQIFDFDQAEDGNLFIAMEYVVGKNLKQLIRAESLGIAHAVRLAIQIADGLAAAHRAGVIHRDIKPENIMVVSQGNEVKLMDFGIARLREAGASTRLTRAGMIMGTPAYMAPEQIEGRDITEKTDIYAFGIVLYEMLSKAVPFAAPTPAAVLMKHLKETPVPLRKLRREIPPRLERIVIQALEKRPERRPRKMEQIVEALRAAERDLAPETVDQILMMTQPLEVMDAGVTGGQSGTRGMLGRLRRVLYGNEDVSAITISKQPGSEDSPRLFSDAPESPATTNPASMPATVALTQPVDAISHTPIRWKPIALGGSALVLVAVGLWLGIRLYRQVPNQQDSIIPRDAKTKPETLQAVASARINTDKAEPTVNERRPQSAATVSEPRLLSLRIRSDNRQINVKERLQLRARATYADGRQIEIEKGLLWESSDSRVATVNSKGEVLGQRDGIVRITARSEEIASAPVTLRVKAFAKEQESQSGKATAKTAVKRPPAAKAPQPGNGSEFANHLRLARSYRERGDYSQALAELEKAGKVNPGNKEVQGEIAITKRACNAERTLGRSDLNC